MRRLLSTLAALVLGSLFTLSGVQGQNVNLTPTTLNLPSTAVSGNCPAPVSGSTITVYCWAADKFEVSANGAAYVVIWPAAAASPTLTINGTTKTLPASFTVVAAAPVLSAATSSAPVVTAQ